MFKLVSLSLLLSLLVDSALAGSTPTTTATAPTSTASTLAGDLPLIKRCVAWSAISYCPTGNYSPSFTCKACQQGGVSGTSSVTVVQDSATTNTGFVALSTTDNAIIVAFRGTDNYNTFANDVEGDQVTPSYYSTRGTFKVEQGFETAYASIRNGILNAVNTALFFHPSYSIIVTGHSLGASMASIAFVDFMIQNKAGGRISLITFGEPRTGNVPFAQYISNSGKKIWRVVHSSDAVPHLPPNTILNKTYIHHTKEVWLNPFNGYQIQTCDDTPYSEDTNCMETITSTSREINAHVSYWNLQISDLCGANRPATKITNDPFADDHWIALPAARVGSPPSTRLEALVIEAGFLIATGNGGLSPNGVNSGNVITFILAALTDLQGLIGDITGGKFGDPNSYGDLLGTVTGILAGEVADILGAFGLPIPQNTPTAIPSGAAFSISSGLPTPTVN